MENIKNEIRTFILENYPSGGVDLSDGELLFESGIIDSFGFVKLIAFIEERFGVTFNRADIAMSKFSSIDSIAERIREKKKI